MRISKKELNRIILDEVNQIQLQLNEAPPNWRALARGVRTGVNSTKDFITGRSFDNIFASEGTNLARKFTQSISNQRIMKAEFADSIGLAIKDFRISSQKLLTKGDFLKFFRIQHLDKKVYDKILNNMSRNLNNIDDKIDPIISGLRRQIGGTTDDDMIKALEGHIEDLGTLKTNIKEAQNTIKSGDPESILSFVYGFTNKQNPSWVKRWLAGEVKIKKGKTSDGTTGAVKGAEKSRTAWDVLDTWGRLFLGTSIAKLILTSPYFKEVVFDKLPETWGWKPFFYAAIKAANVLPFDYFGPMRDIEYYLRAGKEKKEKEEGRAKKVKILKRETKKLFGVDPLTNGLYRLYYAKFFSKNAEEWYAKAFPKLSYKAQKLQYQELLLKEKIEKSVFIDAITDGRAFKKNKDFFDEMVDSREAEPMLVIFYVSKLLGVANKHGIDTKFLTDQKLKSFKFRELCKKIEGRKFPPEHKFSNLAICSLRGSGKVEEIKKSLKETFKAASKEAKLEEKLNAAAADVNKELEQWAEANL